MDRQLRRLGVAFLLLFVLLFVQLNYLQVFAAKRISENPANLRLVLQEFDTLRGPILARDARTIMAVSRPTDDKLKYLRRYPSGELYAHLTGFSSFVFGRTDLERSQDDFLSGRAPQLLPQNLVDEILGRTKQGATVITTIDPALQKVAQQALGSLPGGVVAIDPRTGEVLALVANPTYDPNPLASHDTKEERAAWASLTADPSQPLLSRANEELYPPGSTFKMVTASAALESGMTPDTKLPNPPQLDLPQTDAVLHNFGDEHCASGAPQITLAEAFAESCNVTFGEIGLRLGGDAVREQAERYGFNGDVPFQIPFAEGQVPASSLGPDRLPNAALSAIGLASVAANPLQMALVAQAIANGGVELLPNLVSEIRDPSGRVVSRTEPTEFGRPISARTANELTQMMVGVVDHGTGTAAQIPGVAVAGKTGTAQTPSGRPHAWFVGFAPAEQPTIVVAVVVLNGGDLGSEATGGRVAAPVARSVIEAALRRP
jgi:peptidoglycan glycosyltransferase